MTHFDWFQLVNLIVFPVLYFVWKRLERVRDRVEQVRANELTHIGDQLRRIETKLDQHLLDHAKR